MREICRKIFFFVSVFTLWTASGFPDEIQKNEVANQNVSSSTENASGQKAEYSDLPETPGVWRFWTVQDGLSETYSSNMSIGPTGNLLIMQGQISKQYNVYDGYEIHLIPKYEDLMGAIFEGPTGLIWSFPLGVPNLNSVMVYQFPQNGAEGEWNRCDHPRGWGETGTRRG